MKKIMTLLAFGLTTTLQAQTLNVQSGSVVYAIPAAQAGNMEYSGGSTLTILNRAFTLSAVDKMYVDNSEVTDNTVAVAYNGTSATVTIAGNIAQYVTATVSGAHVSVTQTNTDDVDGDEITYVLSGTSTDGEFYMTGSYKATVELNGLTLTNATPVYSGAAVHIQDGKRVNISVKKGTTNVLTDCANPSTELAQKSALYVKGHMELKGKGTLHVYGKYAHAIKSGEYTTMKNCTVDVKSAVKDGLNCSEFFYMESGSLSISGVGDDGIQCDLDGDTSTGELTDHEGEDSGNVYIQADDEGNSPIITITTTAAATKGIKASGDMKIAAGTLTITTSGTGTYDSSARDAKGCAGLSADGNMTISGGTLTLKNTGSGGKCIKVDGTLTISDGTLTATNTGSQYRYSSSYTASAKAIKCDGALKISGGNITASASSHEAIESKKTIDISGGYIYAYSADDAINSASTFTINGGFVMGNSTGNDGLDANGNFYIKGGTVFAVAARSPEVGIDANTEGGYKLYVTGGTIIAIGGLESGSSLTQTCYQSSSYSKGSWYALYNGGALAMAFKVPSNSNMGSTLVVSTSGTTTLKSGVTVSSGTNIWNNFGNTGGTVSGGSSVSLSQYTGGGGGPGGGGGGGRW